MKKLLFLFIIISMLTSCVTNLATKASFAPLFEKQGDAVFKGCIGPSKVQGDLSVAVMPNIAVGVNGSYSLQDNNLDIFSDVEDRKHDFTVLNVGFFDHHKKFYYEIFGGYGTGRSKSVVSEYSSTSDLNSTYKQFDLQTDLAFKFTKITKTGHWVYKTVGYSFIYTYNEVDNLWFDIDKIKMNREHLNPKTVGNYFFYRVGGQYLQGELNVGLVLPLDSNSEAAGYNYGNSGMFTVGLVHLSVGFSYDISHLFQRK